MQIVNIHEAKTQLSKLIAETQKGEEVIIGKAGKPVAELIPFRKKKLKRVFGQWKGKVYVPPDFDEEDEEINRMFYGDEAEK
jgi:prevent-host-death family protein